MKLPAKDRETVPWMSQREIPAVKAVLSAWRRMRKDLDYTKGVRRDVGNLMKPADMAENIAKDAAVDLEIIANIDERLRKEKNQ